MELEDRVMERGNCMKGGRYGRAMKGEEGKVIVWSYRGQGDGER